MLDTQNKSHAVMSQRHEPRNSLDDFPTPPWATRALLDYVIESSDLRNMTCREPACGRGYMSETLKEYFGKVYSSDIAHYGYAEVNNFLNKHQFERTNWLITNPPYRLAEEFIIKGLKSTDNGVAVLVRTLFLEGKGRYERLFSKHPPTTVAQFVERVPIIKARLDRKASSATGYAWIIWNKAKIQKTQVVWIPPCRKKLEKHSDYF